MVWNDVLAATPLREISRGLGGLGGLVGIAIHATVLAFWCAEAALTETTGSDGAARSRTPRPSSATCAATPVDDESGSSGIPSTMSRVHRG